MKFEQNTSRFANKFAFFCVLFVLFLRYFLTENVECLAIHWRDHDRHIEECESSVGSTEKKTYRSQASTHTNKTKCQKEPKGNRTFLEKMGGKREEEKSKQQQFRVNELANSLMPKQTDLAHGA